MNSNGFRRMCVDEIRRADNVAVLEECTDFYSFVMEQARVATRICICCLALGCDEKTEELARILGRRLREGVELVILADKTRNEEDEGILAMFYRHGLRGSMRLVDAETSRWLPNLVNNALGVYHSKLYIFDETVLMTGANLYGIYYENRADRYYVIKSRELAEYYCKMVVGEGVWHDRGSYGGQSEGSMRETGETAMGKWNSISLENVQFQVSTFNQKNEKEVLLRLFETEYSEMAVSTAYLNMPGEYLDALRTKEFKLFVPAPENNTFNTFGFFNQVITQVYAYTSYYTANRLPKCELYEYTRPNYSFHKKGIWVFYEKSAISVVGSSNYNLRSNRLDEEQNFMMFTEDKRIIAMWREEIRKLEEDCKKRSVEEMRYRCKLWVMLIFILANFLF
ncbi:PGPS1 [Enterospora canceri]|uniref:CDP-diacylglycerol--glycerol-3-phosphate 3-phosphatidyltransferase n=1 Tax=Enterospora canceri TaxID=1081671 RepID=A0A1Y1S7Y3_9MICR|nr:PGPS1 [Enterospora canceri]